MATIEKLIERIETRLFLAAGIDVQIHAEDQLVEMLRGVYETLFDDFWYPEYTYPMTVNIDEDGRVVEDISASILRYKDIRDVYWNEDEDPLPRIVPNTALGRVRRKSIMPDPDPTKVFRIYPVGEAGPAHVWYRTRIAENIWDDQLFNTNIPFDDNVLMYGVVYEFLLNDDSNQNATAEYKNKYMSRQDQMRKAQWTIPMAKRKQDRDAPLARWEVEG